ncbi:hypothetical protein GUITHDRAFT_99904 [Guillardia theta CCMP2712]|uniref:Smr domain-containing protein n=3 Tax=Guillardia theta TaxID=55529 RepID=L1K1U4_GUITC|nr:hypothetical protein GUITHDRAFT_99904 [Guillardia theta CCMP2712]EKX54425.1 hypothetical protein GUITHDRAFT_99904 [Guillardia theta CCMP2712]|eukprot:XP_005841405.1 hypothetical protein GUITHDRAFT_99904 [Guillardia theta CCMP2712]
MASRGKTVMGRLWLARSMWRSMTSGSAARAEAPDGLQGKERRQGEEERRRIAESKQIMMKLKQLSSHECMQFFRSISLQGKADVYHYTEMISKSSSASEAEELMQGMLMRGIAPTTATYTLMLKKYQEEGKMQEVRQIVEELEARDSLRDNHLRSIVIYAFCRNHGYSEAEKFWNTFKRRDPKPDLVLYNSAVYMFTRLNKLYEARMTIREVKQAGLHATAQTYTPLIDRYANLRMFEEVKAILEEMDSERIMLDKRAFNAIMRTLSRSGKMQNMYNLISNMHNFGIDSQFEPRLILDFLVCDENFHAKEKHLSGDREGPQPGSPPQPPTSQEGQQEDGGQKNFPEMDLMRKWELGGGAAPDGSTISILIATHGRAGETDKALALFEELKRRRGPLTSHVYTSVIFALCLAGRLEEAGGKFEEMRRNGCQLGPTVLNALIDGHMAKGDGKGAMRWFTLGLEEKIVPFSSCMRAGEDGSLYIDLHSMSPNASVLALEYGLSFNPPGKNVTVVTGQGKHSPGRQSVLKPAVKNFLEREGLEAKEDERNAGRLVIAKMKGSRTVAALCTVVLVTMWLVGIVIAREWLVQLRRRVEVGKDKRKVEDLQRELRDSKKQHSVTS